MNKGPAGGPGDIESCDLVLADEPSQYCGASPEIGLMKPPVESRRRERRAGRPLAGAGRGKKPMADVFISYSRKDKAFVQRLDEAHSRIPTHVLAA
jgi:hypothetical protein